MSKQSSGSERTSLRSYRTHIPFARFGFASRVYCKVQYLARLRFTVDTMYTFNLYSGREVCVVLRLCDGREDPNRRTDAINIRIHFFNT